MKLRKYIVSITFVGFVIRYRKGLVKGVKQFAANMKIEAAETKVAGELVAKHMRGETLTPAENEAVREQFHDLLKMVGIGIPMAILPGGSVLIPLLVKFAGRHNIKLMPSSFDDKNKS